MAYLELQASWIPRRSASELLETIAVGVIFELVLERYWILLLHALGQEGPGPPALRAPGARREQRTAQGQWILTVEPEVAVIRAQGMPEYWDPVVVEVLLVRDRPLCLLPASPGPPFGRGVSAPVQTKSTTMTRQQQ